MLSRSALTPILAAILMLCGASLVDVTPVAADTLTVTSTVDAPDASLGNGVCATSAGACTLRAAIQEAHARGAGPHTINLATAGTYALTITAADDGRGDENYFRITVSKTIANTSGSTVTIDGRGSSTQVTNRVLRPSRTSRSPCPAGRFRGGNPDSWTGAPRTGVPSTTLGA